MIIWLASYPRSGNSLLTTALDRCFGLSLYARHQEGDNVSYKQQLVGCIAFQTTWGEFYQNATNSKDITLVKTHFPPEDNQPFIYIVRDGRLAIQSYKKFHENFTPNYDTNLIKLIVGDDAYSDWSSHFYQWNQKHQAKKLLVRYEELVNPSEALLQRIASFLDFHGEIKPFVNPFEEYHKILPTFFREGKSDFQPIPEWTPLIDNLFYQFHGQLMQELGYSQHTSAPIKTQQEQSFENDLFGLIKELILNKQTSEKQLQEKEAWIVKASQQLQEKEIWINKSNQFTQSVLLELKNKGINIETSWN